MLFCVRCVGEKSVGGIGWYLFDGSRWTGSYKITEPLWYTLPNTQFRHSSTQLWNCVHIHFFTKAVNITDFMALLVIYKGREIMCYNLGTLILFWVQNISMSNLIYIFLLSIYSRQIMDMNFVVLIQYFCNSQSTDKQPIHCHTYDRIPIGFITYDIIILIDIAVTLLLYLNLCAYCVWCSSAMQHTYLINLQRYDNRSQRIVPQTNTSSTYLTHLGHSDPAWAIPTPLGPFRPHLGHSNPITPILTQYP